MALIDCPSCNKKVSDKAEECNHCGFALGQASEEDIARKRNLQKYLKSQKIQTQSMIAMLMFVTGFGFMYWGGAVPGELQYNIAVGVAVIGFVWYIVNRVRLVFVKKSN
ncbi:zinc ribbon domain-containing protein [Paraglaciecola chathamensis]|jgi:hypothetical protein|uniref:Zn-ribbon protein n=1 Tax=Paraglaciecola chathamensis S18K6 TaxID=1127672 RepID=A0AAV3UT35_9ALTE|nr:zinc ribbon domain-containing protein [Paraglaciecola chathamensis]GAC08085.1 zn-ribbon protein [Paraglaciecola chathamensis S18K6]